MDTLVKDRETISAGDIPPGDFLPAAAPTHMTMQALERFEPSPACDFAPMLTRRGIVLSGTAILTAVGCNEMYRVLQVGGVTVLEWIILALFVLLFAWIAFSFMSALAGFFVLVARKKDELGIDPSAPLPAIHGRTAMLLPTYNEDPHRVLARLRATYESIEETGNGARFDWFVLSDTTDPATWIAEEKSFLKLRKGLSGAAAIFYRHRPENIARKSGNIEDWVRRFGSKYECMLILDADSLMTGDCVVRLAAAMEAHPKAALIQTLPVIVNAKSLFARWQQFAGRLYGPMLAAGIAWWHGSEGNYWGHNAIIRVRAFALYAGLPELSGRKPFGGHIMSHDFIEAALMRRGGWAIHMAPTLRGSYEESPPTLSDFAARDRRWCQGNLQHLALLPTRGFHWISRLHLLTGIGSYLTAPLWLIFLIFGILVSLQAQFVRPEYFQGIFAVSAMAGAGSSAGGVGVRRHDGDAHRAQAAGIRRTADRHRHPEKIRRRHPGVCRHRGRDHLFGPDRAYHDDLSVVRRRRNSFRTRRRLAGSTPRGRRYFSPGHCEYLFRADIGRHCHDFGRLCGLAAIAAMDDAGDPRPAAFHTNCIDFVIGWLESPVQILHDAGANAPPAVLVRANELASAPRSPHTCRSARSPSK
jgi:membrane glycosyltransferase